MHVPSRRALAAVTSTLLVGGLLAVTAPVGATPGAAPLTPRPAPRVATTPSGVVVSEDTAGGLTVENSFVSAVGWVKPGDSYPSRVIATNTTSAPITGATATVTAPQGSTIVAAGPDAVGGASYTWSVPTLEPGQTATLVLESRAATTAALPTIVWRDLSTTAEVTVGGDTTTVTSHGPRSSPRAASSTPRATATGRSRSSRWHTPTVTSSPTSGRSTRSSTTRATRARRSTSSRR